MRFVGWFQGHVSYWTRAGHKTIFVWRSSVNPNNLFVLGTREKAGFEGRRMFIVYHVHD